jgi:DNA-binding transcriptional regulator YiaG
MTTQEIARNERSQGAAEGGAEARLIDRFTERPEARARRLATKRIDPAQADAIRRAFGLEG